MKKISYTVLSLFLFTGTALAQQGYEVLAPLPNIQGQTTINSYVPAAINIAITVGAVLAFVMITFGGILYATTDAISGKQKGKDYITNAIYGLLLVIGAWVILNFINPDTLNFNFSLDKPNIGTAPAGTGIGTSGGAGGGAGLCPPCNKTNGILDGYTMTDAQIASDKQNRGILGQAYIYVNNSACTTGNTRLCTNLNDLPQVAISGLTSLAGACSRCNLLITGGTEGGHSSHGPGNAAVDLNPDSGLNNYLGVASPYEGAKVTRTINGRTVVFTYESVGGNPNGTSTGNHWHVTFQ